ncbi:interstitial collagenase-like [Amblyomma americanum]
MRSQEALVDAVKEFQRFFWLRVTGRVDNETAATMHLPRCGVRDKVDLGLDARRRRRRYTLQGSKWPRNELSYRISKYPQSWTDRVAVDREIARAFKMWSDVSPLTFTHKETGPVDIDIQFVRGEHGDWEPFDGPGGLLAHGLYPRYGGDAHFDDEEKWTIDEYNGVNLFQMAAHEFGHSLGLSHSDVPRSVMWPFYMGFVPGFHVHRDDIKGIQALYGKVQAGLGPS